MISIDHDAMEAAGRLFDAFGLELMLVGVPGDLIRNPKDEIVGRESDSMHIQISEKPKSVERGSLDALNAMANRRSVNIRVVEHAKGRIKTVRVRNFGQVDID